MCKCIKKVLPTCEGNVYFATVDNETGAMSEYNAKLNYTQAMLLGYACNELWSVVDNQNAKAQAYTVDICSTLGISRREMLYALESLITDLPQVDNDEIDAVCECDCE